MKKILSLHISKSIAMICLFSFVGNVAMPLAAQEPVGTAQYAWSAIRGYSGKTVAGLSKKQKQALAALKIYSGKANRKIKKFIACLEGKDTCTQAEIRQARIYTGIIAAAITILLATATGVAAWKTELFGWKKRRKQPEKKLVDDYTETLVIFAKQNEVKTFQEYINDPDINLKNINWNAHIDPDDPNSKQLLEWVLEKYDSMSHETQKALEKLPLFAQIKIKKEEFIELPKLSAKEIKEIEEKKQREAEFEQEAADIQKLLAQARKEKEEQIRKAGKNGEEQKPAEPQIVVDDIDKQDTQGVTQLHRAVMNQELEKIGNLLAKGADPNLKDIRFGDTPLHIAAKRGLKDIIELLLENQANTNEKNNQGDTPAHLVAEQGDPEIYQLLLQHKADTSIINNKGKTPIEMAGGILKDLVQTYNTKLDEAAKIKVEQTMQASKEEEGSDTQEALQKKAVEMAAFIGDAMDTATTGDYENAIAELEKVINPKK